MGEAFINHLESQIFHFSQYWIFCSAWLGFWIWGRKRCKLFCLLITRDMFGVIKRESCSIYSFVLVWIVNPDLCQLSFGYIFFAKLDYIADCITWCLNLCPIIICSTFARKLSFFFIFTFYKKAQICLWKLMFSLYVWNCGVFYEVRSNIYASTRKNV